MPIGTFSYGGKYPKRMIVFFKAFTVLMVITLVVLVFYGIQFAGKENLGLLIGIAIVIIILTVYMRWYSGVVESHNERLEQQLQLWLQDAVPTEGYMICIEHGMRARYEITIKYNGEEKVFATPCEQSKEFPLANTRGFALMCDATIPVLYSPKYNQVIFVDLSNCEEIL